MDDNRIRFSWNHGLGDTANLCRMIRVYRRRGYEFEIQATPDKRELLRLAGAEHAEEPGGATSGRIRTWTPIGTPQVNPRGWAGNKIGCNLNRSPLPTVGDTDELWRELCEPCDLTAGIPDATRDKVRRFLNALPRPVVLFHGTGNSGQRRKSLPIAFQAQFYRELLDRMHGTLITLDWDDRVPRLANYRVRHLDSFGQCSAVELLALIGHADLMIGVDSGPLHVASLTSTPTVGVWQSGHYPSTYSVPRAEQLNLVLRSHTRYCNPVKRIPWNIVEHPGGRFDPARVAELCTAMLQPPRYGSDQKFCIKARCASEGIQWESSLARRASMSQKYWSEPYLPTAFRPRDIQLRQFVREFCRGGANTGGLSGYCDRNNTFDALLREATRRFNSPVFVETGCIRAEEDWAGTGSRRTCSAHTCNRSAGRCIRSTSIRNTACSRGIGRPFSDRPCAWIAAAATTGCGVLPDGSTCCFSIPPTRTRQDMRTSASTNCKLLPRLHDRSLLLIDDTPFDGEWRGKGRRAVPWALNNGWRILTAGYQVLLCRD